MVSKLLKMLNRESSGINEAALLLGLFTFVSQVLALVRDRFLATYLGAGPQLDLYYASFKIPDFLYISVATLASITVLLPYLSQKYGSGSDTERAETRRFLNQVFSTLCIFLVGICVIIFIVMPWLAKLVAPGFDPEALKSLTSVSRLMLVQPIIIGVSNMLSSVTQLFRRFFVTALSPVLYNVGIIVGIVAFYPMFGVRGIVIGVILGAVMHLLIQLPTIAAHGMLPRFSRINWSEIKTVVVTSIPRTIGLAMSSFTALILTSIASTLGTGSISLFNLTNNMLNVPIGIIGVSYSVASFPTLVKFWNDKESGKFADYILNATRKIIFFSVPVMVLFVVLRAQIVRVILGSQSFSWDDTRLAAACLALFVIGLIAQSLVHLFVRGYYATGNTKKPLVMNFIGEIITIVLAVVFLVLFKNIPQWTEFFRTTLRLSGITSISILALPLAFSLGNIANYFLLWGVFKKDFPQSQTNAVLMTTLQTFCASMIMGVATYGVLNLLAPIINQDRFWGIFAQGLIAGIAGMVIFGILMTVMKNREMIEFMQTLRRKFWKADVVVDHVETGVQAGS